MKKEIKSKELVDILKQREEVIESGYPYYDKIEKIVEKVILNNMSRIAADNEMWKYLKPYVDEKEYKDANVALSSVYRKLQKLEYKMNRLKEKTMAKVEKEDIKLKEFEEISTVKLDKDKVYVVIIDKIESYKQMLRENNEKK